MADRYIERLFRRLILAGVPMLPWAVVACSGSGVSTGTGSCAQNGIGAVLEEQAEVLNPDAGADANVITGGFAQSAPISADAYQRCADTLDCFQLCMEVVPSLSGVDSCQRVPTDGDAPGSERVALDIRYTPSCTGRRLAGRWASPPLRARDPVGAYLARAAVLEGLSVPAFQRLARELDAHGAPLALVARARRAARDEVRHRRTMTALARRYGAEPALERPEPPTGVRSLAEVALENAAEGCVRETFGAVVAAHQAVAAADAAIRAGLRAIARDEAGHAALAWDVHEWASSRLPVPGPRALKARLREEVDVLAREASATPPHPALMARAGVPAPRVAVGILSEMRLSLGGERGRAA
jgi:hypothetical protein